VSRERDARGSADTEGAGGEGQESGSAGGASGNDSNADAAGRSGDLKSSGSPPPGANDKGDPGAVNQSGKGAGGSGAGAQRQRSGSDDDIVAKRLRKAAEEETDPELKERLWKEYEEYKRSTT
jgi:hypothetical protein